MNSILENKIDNKIKKIKNNEELKFKFDIGIIELLGSQLYTQLKSVQVMMVKEH